MKRLFGAPGCTVYLTQEATYGLGASGGPALEVYSRHYLERIDLAEDEFVHLSTPDGAEELLAENRSSAPYIYWRGRRAELVSFP